jgi:hypothetical protein
MDVSRPEMVLVGFIIIMHNRRRNLHALYQAFKQPFKQSVRPIVPFLTRSPDTRHGDTRHPWPCFHEPDSPSCRP